MATRLTDVRAFPRSGADIDDDKSLVLAFQSGDIDAYSDIFVKYRALSAQICYRILQDREETDEAVQETMLRVYRGLGRFNGRYQLQAWVARIATNVALDMVRARSRRPQRDPALSDISEDNGLVISLTEDTSEAVERVLDQEEIRSILSSIPDHHREALVLREFEGRSHEEIGDALGVTPQQAKALIHRAKKSFRRAWTEGGDRRGVAALAPIILLAPFRLPGILRRLWQPAHDVVASATATVQQAAVQVSAAPAVTQTAVSMADKVTAAAITVIVAGTVGVGAITIRHVQKPSKQTPVTASPAPITVAPPVYVAPPVRARPAAKAHHNRPRHKPEHQRPGGQGQTGGVPTETPTESPAPTEPSPSPDPESPPPPPPPAPAWSLGFKSSIPFGDPQLALVTSTGRGTAGHDLTFHQTVSGPTLDADGNQIGHTYLEYWGSTAGADGSVDMWLIIDTAAGRCFYKATGSLTASTLDEEGVYSYTFSAGYYLESGPPTSADGSPMLHDGTVDITVRYWSDKTSLFAASVALQES